MLPDFCLTSSAVGPKNVFLTSTSQVISAEDHRTTLKIFGGKKGGDRHYFAEKAFVENAVLLVVPVL